MIEVDAKGLTGRRADLLKALKPLCKGARAEIVIQPLPTQTNVFLGKKSGVLREIRHPSRVDGFFLNYFEIWRNEGGNKKFVLEKAYFHVDQSIDQGAASLELIAVHCDPTTAKGENAFLYKSGPHMHFNVLPGEMGKSHVALCLDSRDRVTSDIATFRKATARIFQMVNVEMVARLASV